MKTLLTLLACSALTLGASAKVTEKFSQTYPLAANGTIELDNANGNVEIVAWDKAEVSLEAEKSAANQEALARLNLKIDSAPDLLRIKVENPRRWKLWENSSAQVRFKLMVPAGATLDRINVVNANISVTGMTAFINLDTVNGSIDAKNLSGPGRFDTVNGSITVAYAAMPDASAEISLDTVNGGCTLKLPAQAGFRLDADTVNGRTSCEFPITMVSGKHDLRGTVNGGGPRVKLDSVNGSLSVVKSN